MRTLVSVLVLCALVLAAAVAAAGPPLPLTPKRTVMDHYWGVPVADDYRWLENWNDPAVRAWSDSESAVTRAWLDALPMRSAVLAQIEALTGQATPSWYGLRRAGGLFFAIKSQPPKQQPLLVTLRSLRDLKSEKVLLDPNALDPSGATTIDFFVPSRDGRRVAVSLSVGGTESGTVTVYDVASGKRLPDEVPRVQGGTAGGSVAWNADGSGFWCTRYPAPGERPEEDLPFYQQVHFHRLGTPAESDPYVVGREFPKIAEILLTTSEDGRWVLADVLNGDGGDHAFWLAGQAEGVFRPLTTFADRVVAAEFGGDALFLLSLRDAPNGKVLHLPLADPSLAKATVFVPEGDGGIEWFKVSGDRLYVEEIVGGPSRVRVFTLAGGRAPGGAGFGSLPLPDPCTVDELIATGKGAVAFNVSRYTEPDRWLTWAPGEKTPAATALASRAPVSFDDIEVRSETAVSKDGTRVPLTILMRKGTPLDGTAPTLIYGYGGYVLGERPSFSVRRRVWFDQGGIWVDAHVRGGNEFGDAWHTAGNLTRKQNVFDDFAACAQWLVDHRYTSPAHFACQGGSNGGILMGAMITQHPALFRAVVSSVGVYDMLRSETEPNGLFNTTEYGTVKDAAQFAALYGYSPYQHVVDGTPYPAVLLPTGANDPRVDPMQSRKFCARLQAATTSGLPVLLRAEAGTGHVGTPLKARNELTADIYSFLFEELGVAFHAPPPIPPAK
jgi:prolyl oligopeptidase